MAPGEEQCNFRRSHKERLAKLDVVEVAHLTSEGQVATLVSGARVVADGERLIGDPTEGLGADPRHQAG